MRLAGLAVAVWLGLATTAFAIDVEQVIWGFDGQAVAQRFNPVSIEFSNPTSQPFDGRVVLRRSSGGLGARTGAEIVQQVYVGPFERSRWVQFYAYLPNEWETWRLSWPGGAFDLPAPINRERTEPVQVLLFDAEPTSRRAGGMKQFPDHLFPPMVTATDTLETAVLGHVPRWQEPRQRALRDWLYGGGTLHLLTDDAGRRLDFPPVLADLNDPAERFAVGRGFVHRHQRSRGQLDAQYVKAAIAAALHPARGQGEALSAGPGGPDAALDAAAQELERRRMAAMADAIDRRFYDGGFVETAFEELKEMTRPDHNWALIYLLALVYIAFIFPGCHLLGLRRIDYRLVYAALLAVIALFSFAFAFVGRRGYGEATAVNSVAVARALPDGDWDVTGWSNAFVTPGDTYRISHRGSSVLYATAQSNEAVAGRIVNGPGAAFDVDIPAYSSRTFVYRMKLNLPDAAVRVVEWNPDGDSRRIVLAASGPLAAIPDSAESAPYGSSACYAIFGDSLHTLEQSGEQLVLHAGRGQPLSSSAVTLMSYRSGQTMWFTDTSGERNPEDRYRDLQLPLMVQSLRLEHPSDLKDYRLPTDRVRLFVYGDMPAEFFVESEALGRQAGRVLYTLDVFRPHGAMPNDEARMTKE